MENPVTLHRVYAASAENRSPAFRIGRLEKLRSALVRHRDVIVSALAADLCKPEMEVYATELGPVIREIGYAQRNLRKWMRWQRPGAGRRIIPSPFGASLIIGTWNYPVQLTLVPVVSAMAAGNGITVKPSESAPATGEAVRRLIESEFQPEAVSVRLGGPETTMSLMEYGYDKIFFTGSPRVGSLIAGAAAKHHGNITLELGGKSPVIVGPDCDITFAAKRIAWGKFLNAGQTCTAPDYLLVPEHLADAMTAELNRTVTEFFGDDPYDSPDLAGIINDHHFNRLAGLLKAAGVSAPMDGSRRYIAPTVVRCTADSPLMAEELFGPILPVLTYTSFDEIVSIVERHPNPLALYIFTKNRSFERRCLTAFAYGGAMVNDTILHVLDPRIPFGGRGASGSGSCHGRFGFEAFSHFSGVVKKRQGWAGSSRFPPYRKLPVRIRKMLFGI